MKILKDKKNELMNRREVEIEVEAGKNPGFVETSKIISEHFKAPEENIMVENVKSSFGSNKFILKAGIYDTKELKEASIKRLIKQKKEKAGEAVAEGEKK